MTGVMKGPKRSSAEAYSITTSGADRARMQTSEKISYEGALILGTLLHEERLTVGQLADVCPQAYNIRDRIYELVELGLIRRNDGVI